MREAEDIAIQLIERFQAAGKAQVEGYDAFEWASQTEKAIVIRRKNGQTARIPKETVVSAIALVRRSPEVYQRGPNQLQIHGVSHVSSPVWAILHLATLSELRA